MQPYDYRLPDKARDTLLKVLPDIKENTFLFMLRSIEEKAWEYFNMKAWLEESREKPSSEIKRLSGFKYYAEGLYGWLGKNEGLATDYLFNSDIDVAELRSKIRWACNQADTLIGDVENRKQEPRHNPTAARRLFLWDLAIIFENATGKQPSVSYYEPKDSASSEDALHGLFLDFASIVLNAVGVRLSRHTLYDEIKLIRAWMADGGVGSNDTLFVIAHSRMDG